MNCRCGYEVISVFISDVFSPDESARQLVRWVLGDAPIYHFSGISRLHGGDYILFLQW